MRLKEFRKQRKINQKVVADYLNCSQAVYSRYESGEREPTIDVLVRLADFYNITLDELVGRTPMDVVATKETAPLANEAADEECEIIIESDEPVPSPDDLDRRIVELIRKELKKKGL